MQRFLPSPWSDSVDLVIYFPSMEIINAPIGEQNIHESKKMSRDTRGHSSH